LQTQDIEDVFLLAAFPFQPNKLSPYGEKESGNRFIKLAWGYYSNSLGAC
jgi:hypothetical protein